MERRFSIKAKSFCFSSKEGSSLFRLDERRKKFVGYIFVSTQCSAWLVDTVEAVCQVKEDIAKSFREGDKALMVHGGANKAGRFLEVAVFAEGGRKGGLWLLEGHDGRGWQHFAGELRRLVASGSSSVKSLPTKLVEAEVTGECSKNYSFAEVLQSKTRTSIEAKIGEDDLRCTVLQSETRIKRLGWSSMYMDPLQISLSVEAGIGGEDVRLTVDCLSLEPPVMVAGTVHLRRKKKGKFGICGVLSLLGQIKRKLDRIFVGPAPKPNRKRKWVRVVGLSTFGVGWAHGSGQKSDLGLSLDLVHYSLSGLDSGTGQKMSTGLILEPDLVEVPSLVPSEGNFLGSEDGLELATRGVMPLSSDAGVEPSSCLGVPASSVSELSPLVCLRGSVAEDVEVKDSGDSPATKATPTTSTSIGYDAGDGFGDSNGSADADKLLVPGFLFPSVEDFPVGFLSRDWEDFLFEAC
jgi:hypothetical protein